MDRLSDVTIGDILTGLGRYRPAVVTVVAVVAMIVFLPGERFHRAGLDELLDTSPGGFSAAPAANAAATSPAAAVTPTTEAPTTFAVQPSGTFGTSSSFESSSGSFTAPSGFSGDEDAAAPDAPLLSDPGFTTSSRPTPLRVTAKLYATNGAGTPVGTSGVPAGSLPVGKRLGQEDKRSYVRLSGTETTLRLSESSERRETQGPIAVQACQVTATGWSSGEGVAFSAAPAFDSAACVQGQRAIDGVWSFDLAAFATRTDDRGIALVVAGASGLDWQINLTEITSSGAG